MLGVFGFLLAHGTSAGVAFALRRERNAEEIDALLSRSGSRPTLLTVLGFGGVAVIAWLMMFKLF